ncbi:MAG: uracil phosphoribosyltransferase [Helicobacteraceae bacterium]|jgi:uracil phosphoribosyltransferase|nr:uracil phosphoribosyltransferase [Helicobacteraceae bacterium]
MTYELNSPLSTHLVNTLRDSQTDALRFRQNIKTLSLLLADRALQKEALQSTSLFTWQGRYNFQMFDESNLLFVTVMRAGLPMLEALMDLFPDAQAGFLAIKRDETTHKSKLYYDRVPDCKDKHLILVDPMIATGGSMIDAMELLKERGASKITSFNIIGSPEGLARIEEKYTELDIYIAQIDERLNDDKYIIPGLGDAGDRQYNTPE